MKNSGWPGRGAMKGHCISGEQHVWRRYEGAGTFGEL